VDDFSIRDHHECKAMHHQCHRFSQLKYASRVSYDKGKLLHNSVKPKEVWWCDYDNCTVAPFMYAFPKSILHEFLKSDRYSASISKSRRTRM
jgi:hypothetical protein